MKKPPDHNFKRKCDELQTFTSCVRSWPATSKSMDIFSSMVFLSIHQKWGCRQRLGPTPISFFFPHIVIQHVFQSDNDNDVQRDLLKEFQPFNTFIIGLSW